MSFVPWERVGIARAHSLSGTTGDVERMRTGEFGQESDSLPAAPWGGSSYLGMVADQMIAPAMHLVTTLGPVGEG